MARREQTEIVREFPERGRSTKVDRVMTRAQLFRSEATPGSSWEVAVRAPAPPLRPYFDAYTGYREESAAPVTRREVAGARIVFILELGPPILIADPSGRGARFPTGFVAGLHDRYALTTHSGLQEGVQIDLSPIGARLLFGTPLAELNNQVVAFGDLVVAERDLSERLRSIPSWDGRFDLLDRVLCTRLEAPSPAGRVAAWAVGCIERAGGDIDVRSLARDLGYSDKHVTRIFREHVGVGPKRFARIVRFGRLMDASRARPEVSWAELALAFGYYDQSHLVREVRDLAGMTPTELRGEPAAMAGFEQSFR